MYGTKNCLEFLFQVFKCASATCGFFYHPHCVAKLIQRVVEDAPRELERNIAQGAPFTCPTHYCYVCKEMEDKKKDELQFAVCRRCPKSYHRKCLPRLFQSFCRCVSSLCLMILIDSVWKVDFQVVFLQKDCF